MASLPTAVDEADVYKKDWLAGRLTRSAQGVEFSYLPDYVAEGRPAVAHTLPLSPRAVSAPAGAVPPFFAGLLPEGLRLTAITRRLKTSADDMLSILVGVGADTIGDVRVLPASMPPVDPDPVVSAASAGELDFRELFRQSAGLVGTWDERVGLPGVQVKVSSEMISIPVQNESGGRWILKLNPPDFPRLVENEAFFMGMARACGLEVADVDVLVDRSGESGLLVRRFDRARTTAALIRFAQEDACQLLNRFPADKYRLAYADACGAVLAVSSTPLFDALRLVLLAAFSYLVGNGDLHAKNISVGERPGGDARLTPAYDLLSTIAYIGNDRLALAIDGHDDNLNRAQLVAFAGRLGVRERAAVRALDQLCAAAPPWIGRLAEIGLDARRTTFLDGELRRRLADLS